MKGIFCVAVLGLMVACEVPALAQGATKTIYDNRGAVVQRWENMGDATIIYDNTNRQVGMRIKRGNRVEVRDSTNRILRYEDEE